MTRFLFVLVAALLGSGCEGLLDPEPVQVRVGNASAVAMEDVTVGFPDAEVSYGTIPPGAVSSYHTVERAYRYAYVKLWIDGDSLVIQPIDYVGERLLEPGRYTYRLDRPDPRYLTLALERDG